MTRVLVVGARGGSVGAAISQQAHSLGYSVVTAGITNEDVTMDLVSDNRGALAAKLATIQPEHIVCTVGMNMPEPLDHDDPSDWYRWHFETNVTGPMKLLHAWTSLLGVGGGLNHYVAISSNSAHVPRSGSAAYCASKAALSQALRVKAREGAVRPGSPIVYGYEPGLVAGTPMTEHTAQSWPGQPLTRMRDPRLAQGVSVGALAWLVVQNLTLGPELNGVLLRIDADEA